MIVPETLFYRPCDVPVPTGLEGARVLRYQMMARLERGSVGAGASAEACVYLVLLRSGRIVPAVRHALQKPLLDRLMRELDAGRVIWRT